MTPQSDRSPSALRAVVAALGITIGAVPATLHAQAATPTSDTASAATARQNGPAAIQKKAFSGPTAVQVKLKPAATQIKLAPAPSATQVKLAPAPSAVETKKPAAAGQTRAEDDEPPVQARPAGASAAPPTR